MRNRSRVGAMAALATLVLTASLAASASAEDIPPDVKNNPLFQPIDAQDWVDQAELTHADFNPVPGGNPSFYDPASPASQNKYRTAVVLLDFTDQPFLISTQAESHAFGNPQPGWTPVPANGVNAWMDAYLSEPNQYNGFHTIHGYWMEDSHGKIGVDVTTFGPYTLPGKLHEFGLGQFNGAVGNQANSVCPAGDTCGRDIRSFGLAAWRTELTSCTTTLCGFDNVFYVTAGHDESSTWQEFGEMLWTDREQVPAEFGPPGAENGPVLNAAGNPIPNWAPTRYVPWSSWLAAANHWPNAGGGSSTQAESSGQSTFEHEFSHLRGLPDNYNNPYADNERSGTGYWEMMSRGTFNGPGGTHNRWQVPNQGGSALGPHHMLEYKNRLGVLTASEQVTLERDTLASQGTAVVSIKARESVPGSDLAGLTVNLGTDLAGTCANQGYEPPFFYCPNRTGTAYQRYRLEVVDQVGNDSFAPGHGVLLSKARNGGLPTVWIIDPNPEDIGMIDFYRPDGTPVSVLRGDPRQLNDATFHAGTNSGSAYEYVDTFNGLHFYVLKTYRDDKGVRFYDVAVRRTTGASPFARGLSLGAPAKKAQRPGFIATCTFPLTNTGQAGTGVFDSDVYRVSATSSSARWQVTLPNALAPVKAGQTAQIPVHVLRNPEIDAANRTTITLTATSESDSTKTATRTCSLSTSDTTPGGQG